MDRVNWKMVNWCWVHWNCVHWNGMHWEWVNWHRVDRGWLVSWGRVSHSVVLDISHVATVALDVGSVVHNLDAAVRKGHLVLASHNVGVGSLLLVKAGARVVVVDAILERVGFGRLGVAPMNWLVNGHGVDWQWVDGDNWGVNRD